MKILGIETSCDETALAIVEGRGNTTRLLRSLVSSQIDIHKEYGGVVPEVAARSHAEIIPLMLRDILGKEREKAFDAIAVTAGPGLMTSLRVGTDVARALSFAWQKPLIAVNHLEGHIAANWLDAKSVPLFPVLALIVSGGHTELVLVKDHGSYKLLGATRDDAAGEAFDKVGKMLRLGFPGGPAVSAMAEKGNPEAIRFPRPMMTSKDFDFSFSGLKTAVLQHIEKKSLVKGQLSSRTQRICFDGIPQKAGKVTDICASFQAAVVDVLVTKTIAAAKKVRPKTVIVCGGVAANSALRKELALAVKKELKGIRYVEPRLAYTTDNAGMIAAAGYYLAKKGSYSDWRKVQPDSGWEIG